MLSFNVSPSNRAGGGQPNQNMGTTPLERIRVLVSKKGIIGVQVPFQTPRAQSVRQFMHARLLNESNQKMFIWRREPNNLWTNISLHSTPESPELTAPPVAWRPSNQPMRPWQDERSLQAKAAAATAPKQEREKPKSKPAVPTEGRRVAAAVVEEED